MPRLDNSIDISAPADIVFQYVADIRRYPEWVKWAKEAEWTSNEEALGVGSTFTMRMQVGPRKEWVEGIVTEFIAGELITKRHTRGMQLTDRLSVLTVGEATKVAWSVEYTPPMGKLGQMGDVIFMSRLFNQLAEDSLAILKERLERTP